MVSVLCCDSFFVFCPVFGIQYLFFVGCVCYVGVYRMWCFGFVLVILVFFFFLFGLVYLLGVFGVVCFEWWCF